MIGRGSFDGRHQPARLSIREAASNCYFQIHQTEHLCVLLVVGDSSEPKGEFKFKRLLALELPNSPEEIVVVLERIVNRNNEVDAMSRTRDGVDNRPCRFAFSTASRPSALMTRWTWRPPPANVLHQTEYSYAVESWSRTCGETLAPGQVSPKGAAPIN